MCSGFFLFLFFLFFISNFFFFFFFFNDTATTEIYTLSLHDALPFLAQPLVLTPKPLQLGRHVLLAAFRRLLHRPIAAVDPVPERGPPHPEIGGNLTSGAPAGLGKPHGLGAELRGEARLRVWHRKPPPSRKELSTCPERIHPQPAQARPALGWHLRRHGRSAHSLRSRRSRNQRRCATCARTGELGRAFRSPIHLCRTA